MGMEKVQTVDIGGTRFPSTGPLSSDQREAELGRAIFQSAVDSIITIDDRGIIEAVNPAVERHFGYRSEELLGKNVSILMPSPDRERHDGYIEHYKKTGERKIIGIGREVVARRRDGSTFPAYLAVSEMVIGGNRKFAGIIRDISDRKRYEDSLRQRATELRQAKDQLEQANRAKDQFLAVLSHELRTPLTPSLAMLEMLEEEPEVQDRFREMLQTVKRNVELEAKLIDDLLDLTRVARGRLRLRREDADVHVAILDTLEICQPDTAQRGLRVQTELHANEPFINADPARLRQILWNLVKNSVKFTPRGGSITIKTWNDHMIVPTGPAEPTRSPVDALVIEVRDTGIGIDPEALPRIFNAFEQAGESISRQFGGLGLGLAITKALVDMHGGRIVAASEGHGKGACFTVHFPIIHRQDAHPKAAVPTIAATPARISSRRILLVDDHPDTLRAIRMLLGRDGHEVHTASCIAEGKQRLAERFDVMVSDIGLPDGSGLELMRYAAGVWPDIRGIALSGYGMEDDIQRSRDAGFHEHLTKPVDMVMLRDAVSRVAATSE